MDLENTETWFSKRFNRDVHITYHARERMAERQMSLNLLQDLIETGTAYKKDERRLWLAKAYNDRDDNLICAAVVLEEQLVVKTIMHRWESKESLS